jgi:hypothetical protein
VQATKSARVWVALGIFAFALLIRLIGIGWGLKNDLHSQSYHPDEPVIFAYSQAIEPTKLSFTPGFYNYGTVYLTLLRVATDMTTAYTGAPDPKSDDSFWAWVSRADLAGRILSALAGAATCSILFLIGSRLFGMFGGVIAGLVISVAPGHVVHSRFQTVDILATCLLAASLLFALQMIPTEGQARGKLWKLAMWSGIFAGLSAGTKYTGLLAVVSLLVAIWFCSAEENPSFLESKAGLAIVGIGATIIAFLIGTPGAILDSGKFMTDFQYEMVHTATGHGMVFAHTSIGFLYHLSNLFAGIGTLLTLVGIAGLALAAYRKYPWALAAIAFFLVYFILIGRAEVKFLRYTFPLYPGIALGVAYLLNETQLRPNWKRFGMVMSILLIGGIDTGGLDGAAKATAWMSMPDPRDQAAEFVKSEAAKVPNSTVGYVRDPWTWSVPFFPDSAIPRMPMGPRYIGLVEKEHDPFLARTVLMQSGNDPKPVLEYSWTPAAPGQPSARRTLSYHDFDVRLLTDLRPDFVTMTTLEGEAVERLSKIKGLTGEEDAAVKQYLEFVTVINRDYELVHTFGAIAPSVEDMLYVQPQVLVWKRKAKS